MLNWAFFNHKDSLYITITSAMLYIMIIIIIIIIIKHNPANIRNPPIGPRRNFLPLIFTPMRYDDHTYPIP